MSNSGSLIQIYHKNYELLAQFEENNGILYYKNTPVFPGISKETGNSINLKSDGLYVNLDDAKKYAKDLFDILKKDSHVHSNSEVLNNLSDIDGLLGYKETLVTPIVTDEEIQQAITDTLKILKEE